MKIPASVRRLYDEQLEVNRRLMARVDDRLKALKEARWHYESRLKSEEAFLLKLESGRFEKPNALEDFFACWLVVENGGSVGRAEAIVRGAFSLHTRRPPKDDFTHKQPEAFPFDDLRLYVSWVDDSALPASGLAGIVFEVQIKTFLQHAWSVATHDLVYKTDQVSWAKARITYQVKALLEHAEVSIQEADRLAESGGLRKTTQRTEALKRTIELVKNVWSSDLLPQDVRRLAENIGDLCRDCGIDTDTLRAILQQEKEAGRGPLTLNLSPFGVVVQSLLLHRRDQLVKVLADSAHKKHRVVVPSEIELPASVSRAVCVNAVFV